MLKNIFFALLSLLALATSPATLAEDQPAVESEYVKALTANNPPEKEAVKQAVPAENPAKETAQPAAAPAPAKEEMQQATPSDTAQQTVAPTSNTRPINDNHVDYRYCLDLKTNREIAECRYKKK
jgi:membrane-bound lytic murein transglycosylase B